MRLIKPSDVYAGLPQGWWLKNYWEYVYPIILAEAREKELRDPDEGQAGPVMYAVGKYARAFTKPRQLVKLENNKIERYHTTNTIHRGFVLPFVKFIALESDGDGRSFAELRNVAQSLALNSDVKIWYKYGKVKGGEIEEAKKQKIDMQSAMDFYVESYPIDLPPPLYGQPGYTGSKTNKAISSSFMAIFEPPGAGRYRIDVEAEYVFSFKGTSRKYGGPKDGGRLHDIYEIVVEPPIIGNKKE